MDTGCQQVTQMPLAPTPRRYLDLVLTAGGGGGEKSHRERIGWDEVRASIRTFSRYTYSLLFLTMVSVESIPHGVGVQTV